MTLEGLLVIAILSFIGVIAYATFHIYVVQRPKKPSAFYEEKPIEIMNLSTEAEVDKLIEEAVGAYRTPILDDYLAFVRKIVMRWPPPLEVRKTIILHLSTHAEAFYRHATTGMTNPFPDETRSPFQVSLSQFCKRLTSFMELVAIFDIFTIPAKWKSHPRIFPLVAQPPGKSDEEIVRDYDMRKQYAIDYINQLQGRERKIAEDQLRYGLERGVTQVWEEISKSDPLYEEARDIYRQIAAKLDEADNVIVYIPYTNEKRFEHTVVLGSAGSGKTTLLSHLILFDLHQDDPPAIILIDPKRTVIRQLSRIALFNEKLKDRLIIISPKDHPAINIFDTTNRPSNVGGIQSVEYLCSMLGQDMTGKQRGLYRNLGNLLLHFKETLGRHATLLDLIELTARKFPPQYARVVAGLAPIQRRFFESGDFESPDYRETKDQIRTRLNSLLASEGMGSLFSSQTNAINVFDELNKGSIILVDTGEGDPLDREESAAFGCIFMSEIVRAVLQRTPLENKGRPAFVYVDEAATFFVGAGILEDFLTSGRQNKVGGIFAFHTLSQAGDDLRSILVTNTSTKLLSKYAVDDIATFGRHMTLTVEEMKAMPDYHWACSIRGVVDKAVTITVPPDELEKEPKMTEADYEALLKRNRARVSGGTTQRAQRPPQPEPLPDGEWTEADDQALADALNQLALAIRRKDTKRAKELQDHINSLLKRKHKDADEDAYQL